MVLKVAQSLFHIGSNLCTTIGSYWIFLQKFTINYILHEKLNSISTIISYYFLSYDKIFRTWTSLQPQYILKCLKIGGSTLSDHVPRKLSSMCATYNCEISSGCSIYIIQTIYQYKYNLETPGHQDVTRSE